MRLSPLILLPILAVLTFMVAADPLYKWVDDQGNVHYSDKPQPGAKKMVLPKASTYAPPAVAQPAPPPSTASSKDESAAQPYTQISVVAPKDQDTIWNTETVTVSVAVVPALQPGDTVTFSVDGNTQTLEGTSATFDQMVRGEHDVTVTVNGKRGGGTLTAQSVFYIQRATIGKPPL